jgi:hypothetical protein
LRIDSGRAHDDITCAAVYFRQPRDLLVITGPPFRREDDREIARIFRQFAGTKVVLGGTTAQIVARELGKTIEHPADSRSFPAASVMEGADLVCEGILTLGIAEECLSAKGISLHTYGEADNLPRLALQFVDCLLNSDRINFVVGTKINEAHHDPTMPVELEIRRNVIKRIAALLEDAYMKQVRIQYI